MLAITRRLLLASAMAVSCAKAEPPAQQDPLGTVRVELPPGFAAKLGDLGETLPLGQDRRVLAGSHRVRVQTPCGTRTAAFELGAGETVVLSEDSFPDLRLASLRVRAKDLGGNPLSPTIQLDDWLVPSGAERTQVPACKVRMTVRAPDLGGFIEDVDFSKDATVTRDIVLAPGSDVVRIHGGEIRTPDPKLLPPEYYVDGTPVPQKELYDASYVAKVPTFDIDQREVTTEEFHQCRLGGACQSTYEKMWQTETPTSRETSKCTTSVIDLVRTPREGKAKVAMNCIVRWEAEEYCRWRGKRLPNVEEWEFAARSRGDDSQWFPAHQICSDPANDRSECKMRIDTAPTPPCFEDTFDTAQGVCGMFGNLAELVEPTRSSVPTVHIAGRFYGSQSTPWGLDWIDKERQRPSLGFRCARDVGDSN